ncbi:uncharacterized protein IL334_003364 [Kwoniella shivajii]|uniref:Uncharacterized protein n=1 Tax=Kwoniella shivajii TaxID=564305 RepID=A0ABZ1CXD9_9TREE|nr:hypothetical protein IL334_003364 [Kwoniella shivajii]
MSCPPSSGAGPSNSTSLSSQIDTGASVSAAEGGTIEIPSTGLEFFEYRRRLFLAGLPLPPNPTGQARDTIKIPIQPPDPIPSPERPFASPAVRRLEELLAEEGSEELQVNWERGVGMVAKSLHAGKRLARGLRLGLVIKILKASWIQDGLWPKDASGRPARPPNSPLIEGVELFGDNTNNKLDGAA